MPWSLTSAASPPAPPLASLPTGSAAPDEGRGLAGANGAPEGRPAAARQRFEALDGMRGLAALAVVWLHLSQEFRLGYEPPGAILAVDFFFCLSGFVIAHAYERRLVEGLSFGGFMKERLIRLMPLAVAGALFGGAVLALHSLLMRDFPLSAALGSTAWNLLLLPGWTGVRPEIFPGDPPLWSLSFEMAINVAFGATALLLTTRRLVVLVAVASLSLLWTAWANKGVDVGYSWSTLWYGLPRVAFPFACGVLLRRLPQSTNRAAIPLCLALAALLASPIPPGWWTGLIVILLVPAIVYLGAGARVTGAAKRACIWLGALSYPLYAMHHPIVRIGANVARFAHAPAALSPALPLAVLAASVGAALLADAHYDRPIRRRLQAMLGAGRGRAEAAAMNGPTLA